MTAKLLWIYFICYLAVLQPTFDHFRGGSPTKLNLITVKLNHYFRSEDHDKPQIKLDPED